jgi:hypothetical protein
VKLTLDMCLPRGEFRTLLSFVSKLRRPCACVDSLFGSTTEFEILSIHWKQVFAVANVEHTSRAKERDMTLFE